MTKEKFLYGEIKLKHVLSPLAIKYIAVICLCVSQIARCLLISIAIDNFDFFELEGTILNVILKGCVEIGKIAVPLMLVWMASMIFSNKDNILRLTVFYGILAVLFYGGEMAFFLLYLIPKINKITENVVGFSIDPEVIKVLGGYFSNFNVFIDLFLCSSICYFAIGQPKKIKSRKGIILFRSCVIFPISYIIASFVLSGLIRNFDLVVNIYTGSLLPRKGLVNFFIFGGIMTFVAFRERLYNRFSKNTLTYSEYENSNRHRINYSIVASLIFIVCSVTDTLLGLIPDVAAYGVGNSLSLMIAIPFLLLHDFTAKPSNKLWSLMIGPIYAFTYLVLFVLYMNLFSAIIKSLIELFTAF